MASVGMAAWSDSPIAYANSDGHSISVWNNGTTIVVDTSDYQLDSQINNYSILSMSKSASNTATVVLNKTQGVGDQYKVMVVDTNGNVIINMIPDSYVVSDGGLSATIYPSICVLGSDSKIYCAGTNFTFYSWAAYHTNGTVYNYALVRTATKTWTNAYFASYSDGIAYMGRADYIDLVYTNATSTSITIGPNFTCAVTESGSKKMCELIEVSGYYQSSNGTTKLLIQNSSGTILQSKTYADYPRRNTLGNYYYIDGNNFKEANSTTSRTVFTATLSEIDGQNKYVEMGTPSAVPAGSLYYYYAFLSQGSSTCGVGSCISGTCTFRNSTNQIVYTISPTCISFNTTTTEGVMVDNPLFISGNNNTYGANDVLAETYGFQYIASIQASNINVSEFTESFYKIFPYENASATNLKYDPTILDEAYGINTPYNSTRCALMGTCKLVNNVGILGSLLGQNCTGTWEKLVSFSINSTHWQSNLQICDAGYLDTDYAWIQKTEDVPINPSAIVLPNDTESNAVYVYMAQIFFTTNEYSLNEPSYFSFISDITDNTEYNVSLMNFSATESSLNYSCITPDGIISGKVVPDIDNYLETQSATEDTLVNFTVQMEYSTGEYATYGVNTSAYVCRYKGQTVQMDSLGACKFSDKVYSTGLVTVYSGGISSSNVEYKVPITLGDTINSNGYGDSEAICTTYVFPIYLGLSSKTLMMYVFDTQTKAVVSNATIYFAAENCTTNDEGYCAFTGYQVNTSTAFSVKIDYLGNTTTISAGPNYITSASSTIITYAFGIDATSILEQNIGLGGSLSKALSFFSLQNILIFFVLMLVAGITMVAGPTVGIIAAAMALLMLASAGYIASWIIYTIIIIGGGIIALRMGGMLGGGE